MAATRGPKLAWMSSSLALAALVLDRVVEQRSDRLVLVAAVLDHQGRDPEEVADVWGVGALAGLVAVRLESVGKGLLEPVAEPG